MKPDEPITTIMSTAVTTVEPTRPLGEVRQLMADEVIHHVPVVRGRKLVGLLSATDLVRCAPGDERMVEAVMQTELVTLSPGDTVRDAARHLRSGQFHALPVVDGEGGLAGIVTSTDLIRYLYDQY